MIVAGLAAISVLAVAAVSIVRRVLNRRIQAKEAAFTRDFNAEVEEEWPT